jgi:glucose/arabinose dehydrogenase
MKLQVNISGSWRNVGDFTAKDESAVRKAALVLAAAGRVRGMRISDDGIVLAYCDKHENGMSYGWRLP